MRKKVNISILALWLIAAQACFGVGRGTMPAGAGRSGLVRSPNPIDRSSDLIVTGNVAGGKEFRGIVPYNATNYFSAVTPSASLDSFLSRSAGTGAGQLYPGGYDPYYSPSRTVASFRAGTRSVYSAPSTVSQPWVSRGAAESAGQALLRPLSPSVVRPLARLPEQVRTEYLEVPEAQSTGRRLLLEQQEQQQVEALRRDIQETAEKVDELTKKIIGPDALQKPENIPIVTRPREDIFAIMSKQLEEAQAKVRAEVAEAKPGAAEEAEEFEPINLEQIVKAKTILGEFTTFAAYSEDRFNQYMRLAEEYLSQGRYYRAADSYTIAAVYKPQDPLAYAGKSHALFMAGEYMSSAHFLMRAMDIFPEYAGFKIDLATMIGDRDKIESRIVDIEQWLEKNDAPELEFLLSYLYHQLGRGEDAALAIQKAYEAMPDSKAVLALKTVIEAAAGK